MSTWSSDPSESTSSTSESSEADSVLRLAMVEIRKTKFGHCHVTYYKAVARTSIDTRAAKP